MGIFVISFFILIGAVFISKLYFKELLLRKLEAENKAVNVEVRILEQSLAKIRTVKNYQRNRGFALEVLAALYDTLPDDIMLTDLKMDSGGNFNLKGTARAMSDVFSFVDALKKSRIFDNVKPNYTTSRKQDNENLADFGISCVVVRK